MYGIKLHDYVPKPEPATADRIVAAHYYPSWKKGAAGLHNGFDDLHSYPERTPLCGYYDGDSPEYCDWEIKWALEHGINCFIYCWYRKKENAGKPVSVSDLRLGETLHNGFFKARYSDMMQFAIMLEASARWAAADEDDLINNLMPFWIEHYFSRPNYLKIDNKPVLFVYDFYDKQLEKQFPTPEAQAKAFDRCRALARAHGFDGMLFAYEYRRPDLTPLRDAKAYGYDFSFSYCWSIKERGANDERIIEYQLEQIKNRMRHAPNYCVPTASCMWDPTPRFDSMPQHYTPNRYPLLWKLTPKNWRRLLREIKRLCDATPENSIEQKMILLDNWNEWDEGHYLLPSAEFGFQYLQAVREELTERDNLPDYRMPDDIGTSPVNTTWDEPDLSDARPHLKRLDGSNGDIYHQK